MCVATYVLSLIFRYLKPYADVLDIFYGQCCKIRDFMILWVSHVATYLF